MSIEQNEIDFNKEPESDSEDFDGDENMIVAEPKRAMNRSTLVIFAILIIGGGGLYFMYRQAGPQSAGAAVVADSSDTAKKTISTFLSGGDVSVRSMEKLLRNTEKVVQTFVKYPSVTQVPLSDLRTNPFRQHAMATKNEEPTSEAMAKKQREEQRLANLKAVQMLQVQSIMFSENRRACMINNTLYREGGQVDSFTIEKISPSSVIVKNGVDRFELRMQRQ